jgi:serine/threonine protein kinase
MEYLPEGDLGAYLRESPPLSENEAAQISSQVLEGLAITHREKYAHRNIKPENILVHQRPVPGGPRSWWVKLTNFGLTKILMRAAVSATTAMGTPGYVAPEVLNQVVQDSDAPDLDHFATDIWSLGATVFHILTGTSPLKGCFDIFQYLQSPNTLFPYANLGQQPVSRQEQEFVRALLERKPEQRPDSEAARSHAWVLSHAPRIVAHGE